MVQHLSQCIAIEKDAKDKAASELSRATNLLGNVGKLSGIARTYTPMEDGGVVLPPESTRVQIKAASIIKDVESSLATLFDVIATKDWTNCIARADVVVDGAVLLKGVPATYLLFLEKQCAELLAFVKRIPTLDGAEVWNYDQGQDCYATAPVETIRTKKDKKSRVVFEGNQHHQPQFLVWDEDVPEGRWKTIKYSGAMQQSEVNAMIARIEKLQRAVKFAREEANRTTTQQQEVGAAILQYIFG